MFSHHRLDLDAVELYFNFFLVCLFVCFQENRNVLFLSRQKLAETQELGIYYVRAQDTRFLVCSLTGLLVAQDKPLLYPRHLFSNLLFPPDVIPAQKKLSLHNYARKSDSDCSQVYKGPLLPQALIDKAGQGHSQATECEQWEHLPWGLQPHPAGTRCECRMR